jgi:hypothetical protein
MRKRSIKRPLEHIGGVADVSLVQLDPTPLGGARADRSKALETDRVVTSIAIKAVRKVRSEYCGHRAASFLGEAQP